MSELAAKLAIRRSKIASPAETAKVAADIEGVSPSHTTIPLPNTPADEGTRLDATGNGNSGTPETALRPSPDSAPWRETPSAKIAPPMVNKDPSAPGEKERDNEGFDNIDDFLGAGLNEGLEKLNIGIGIPRPEEGVIRRRNSITHKDKDQHEDEFIGYSDEELDQLRSQIKLLQTKNKEKDELINALQNEVSRLSRESDGGNDEKNDGELHPLRESETDPFETHVGTRRGSAYAQGRSRSRTRSRINSWADEERKRSSSASMLPFDSPEKMKDMFHLLLEDTEGAADGSAGSGSDAKGWFDFKTDGGNPTELGAEEALFGSGEKDVGKYDPSQISLGSFSLNESSREGTRASPVPSKSSGQMRRVYEDSDLFTKESSVFKNVDSPLPMTLHAGATINGSSAGLFTKSDSEDQEEALRATERQTTDPRKPAENGMSYMDFMNRLSEPESEDLALVIKGFLLSVMGPRGDGTAPSIFQDKEIDYTFYGTAELDTRIADFYRALDGHFRVHVAWQGFSDDKYMSILDCLEKHVLNMIHDLAYDSVVPSTMDDDEELKRQLEILQFLPAEALDIPLDLQNDVVWAVAGNELKKINAYRTAGEKIGCVVSCASLITRTLGAAKLKAGESAETGADDFLPLFIWVVLKSKCAFLYRNTEYISIFHQPTRLMGMGGYCLMNLRSALEFLRELKSADNISMDNAEFARHYEAAVQGMDTSSDTSSK